MKKILLLIVPLLLTVLVQAQTWNGTASSGWNNPLNWTPNVVPGSGSVAVINPVAGFSPQLQSNTTVGVIQLNAGTSLDFNGYSLTITSGTSGYNTFSSATLNNSNPASDIVINVTMGTGGWYFTFSGCTVNDHLTFNIAGSDVFYEGGVANQFNGNVVYNVNGPLTMNLSYGAASTYAGNLTYIRTVAGTNNFLSNSAQIAGNLLFQNNAGGPVTMGTSSATTLIGGTCSIAINNPSQSTFWLKRVKNLTAGGSVLVQNSTGFDIQNDTLKVNSFQISGYKTGAYSYFISNKLEGNLQLADDATYAGGWYTLVQRNEITGTTTFTVNGTNSFYEASGAGNANTYNGNTVFNINNSAEVYISQDNPSQFNGNLTINRNAAGFTKAFNSGGTITGNLSFTNNTSGDMDFGTLSTTTQINGTITMQVNTSPVAGIGMYRLSNQTTGGKINLHNTRGFNIQQDSLKVDSLNVISYRGSAYAYFYNNHLQGNLTIADSTSYGGGWGTTVRNNTVTGQSTFRVYGTNTLIEADIANSGNTFHGATTYNLLGSGSLYVSHGDTSTYDGALTVNRTSPGYTRLFNSGGIINGNFTYNNTASGDQDLGNLSNKTAISGTVNMNVNLAPIGGLGMYRLVNQTAGGKINLKNTLAFNIQSDTLKVDSMNVISYRGNAYAYFYNNQLDGHLTLADSTSYINGYATHVQGNVINGHTTYRVYGTNGFYESNGLNNPNDYNGNVLINMLGPASLHTNNASISPISGNLTVTRTVAGYTRLFESGGEVSGNFSYTKNAAGASDLGNGGLKTNIGGTVNINVTQTTNDVFTIHWLRNQTSGGSVLLNNIRAIDMHKDTLLLNNLNITGYGGNAYSTFYDNQINATVHFQDHAGYTNGYNTSLRNNTINGNTTITILGTNPLIEASAGGLPNTFNGNAVFNGNGSGSLYISHDAKSTFNGNLSINRTVAGTTQAFNAGATVNGNFSYQKNAGGVSELGQINEKTTISGMINMSVTQTAADPFNMYWITNGTTGGNIDLDEIKSFNMQKDSLKLSSFNITNYGNNAYNYFYHNRIEGDLSMSDYATFTNGYNTDVENITVTGNTQYTVNGNNVFLDGNAANAGNTYLGNVTYVRNNASFNIGTGDTNVYYGNYTCSSTSPIAAHAIRMAGANSTTLSQTGSGAISAEHLMIDKSGNADITLGSPFAINNSCQFINGHVLSSAASPLLFVNNATHSGAGSNSHVQGYITKIGDDAFSFPLGTGTGHHPLLISAPASVTDTFTAYLTPGSATLAGYPLTSKQASLLTMNPHFFWGLNQISGSNALSIGLGWGLHPCLNSGIGSLPGLAVARWNGSQWVNLGNSATTGNNLLGSVTQNGTTNNFGPFVLGSTSALNPFFTAVTVTTTGPAGPVCSGAGATLTATGGVSYTWMPGNLTGSSVVVNPVSTTTYTVTATAASGCTATATRTVTVGTSPTITTTTTSSVVCTGASTSITASGATTYSWQPGSLSGTTVNVSPAATTLYTVTGTAAGGCTATATRLITVGTCAACASNIIISTSPYSILLTESQTYIQTSGTVLIDSGSFVKLDAAATSYVLMNPGFKASRGSVFIAQSLNGCTSGAPQLPSQQAMSGIEPDETDAILLYPNPTTGKVTIEHPASLSELRIFDLTGKMVLRFNTSGNTQSDIDIGQLAQGVYVLYAKGYSSIRIIKN